MALSFHQTELSTEFVDLVQFPIVTPFRPLESDFAPPPHDFFRASGKGVKHLGRLSAEAFHSPSGFATKADIHFLPWATACAGD